MRNKYGKGGGRSSIIDEDSEALTRGSPVGKQQQQQKKIHYRNAIEEYMARRTESDAQGLWRRRGASQLPLLDSYANKF